MAEAWGEKAKKETEALGEKAKKEAEALGEKAKKETEALGEELKKDADSSRGEEGVPFSAGTTIDKTCKEISAALARRLGNLPGITATAMLSIKIQKVDKGGGHFEFTVFGVRADAGADRKHKNVHTVSITFTPTGNPHGTSENEFDTAFEQLQPLPGDTTSDYVVQDAAIDLDFSITKEWNVSILAAGDVKDESTHHLKLTTERKAAPATPTNTGLEGGVDRPGPAGSGSPTG